MKTSGVDTNAKTGGGTFRSIYINDKNAPRENGLKGSTTGDAQLDYLGGPGANTPTRR